MRLFVSVDLPEDLAAGIERVQARFEDASGLDPVDPTRAHVTLKFLGEVDAERLPDVEDALDRAVESVDVAPFDATVAGLGVFPSLSYISVVWVGVEDDGQLTRLHDAVEREFVERGFDPEDHDFTPHVTVGRVRHAGGKEVIQRVVEEDSPTVGTMRVGSVALTESTLTDEGPAYRTVRRVPLRGDAE